MALISSPTAQDVALPWPDIITLKITPGKKNLGDTWPDQGLSE